MTAGPTVRLTVNGAPAETPPGTTVTDLLRQRGVAPAGTAVARNGEVVPRSAWAATVVSDADRIEILVAAQGG